jgi:hypothetical protein
MATEIDLIKQVNFDWVVRHESVWQGPECDISELNRQTREALMAEAERLHYSNGLQNPLGHIVLGAAGAGKTHTLATLCQKALNRDIGFVLVDMTDVKDFWETILLGYLSSLQHPLSKETTQLQLVLEHILRLLNPNQNTSLVLKKLTTTDITRLAGYINTIITALSQKYPLQVRHYQDILRALFYLICFHGPAANLAYSWLQGLSLEPAEKAYLGFTSTCMAPMHLVKGISWICSLKGSFILALDQLDSIVQQQHSLSETNPEGELGDEQRAALSIIEGIGSGLSALVRSVTQKTLVVLTCIETTWNILCQKTLRSDTDSYHQPKWLQPLDQGRLVQTLIEARLQAACTRMHFQPPYPSWPFRPSAFASTAGLWPREILRLCETHRLNCINHNKVYELTEFKVQETSKPELGNSRDEMDVLFAELQNEAPVAAIVDKNNEDLVLQRLLQTACRCLLRERGPIDSVDFEIDTDFGHGSKYIPLHCRFRLIDHAQGDLEQHYCFRGIEQENAVAFQSRLKAAMTASGIDRKLPFRRLFILRTKDLPRGKKTQEIVDRFRASGGIFVQPENHELKVLWALSRMEETHPSDLKNWLTINKPVSGLKLMGLVNFEYSQKPVQRQANTSSVIPETGHQSPRVQTEKPHYFVTSKQDHSIPLGVPSKTASSPVISLESCQLAKHIAILAGSGSGKTVLVRRLVEEAALLEIPSIVLDGANDLTQLGDPWPEPPQGWRDDDTAKAGHLHQIIEPIVWTPGWKKGNPLNLSSFPDLYAVRNDRDELGQAVSMTREIFEDIVAPGSSLSAKKKQGILAAALSCFAHFPDQSLDNLISFLSDLPSEAWADISDAPKLALQMADSIRAAVQTNPLLDQQGSPLDPIYLFGSGQGATRISIINLVGLPSLKNQQQFVNQLAMTLFSWIKKHPGQENTSIRGLLVIDEAKDFIPAIKSVPGKSSMLRLAAQARKYGLGLIVATQSPKDLEHTLISNCTTHFYGKASSPNAIEVISEQLRQRGGSGHNIARLKPGQFYVYTENMTRPEQILVPMCLSHHPGSPLDEAAIQERTKQSRLRLGHCCS